ncbi:N-acetylmuramoyl-L-alanine amidase [Ruegeria lacuscaerulensis]|uniref:peptidoglycan recognition protein family protein n=1 Tax=Ruegeria lacuscaerulensis TaxID=55218 RepID=UPI001480E9E9|nr:N-acetylmuramoyl-L-alanine amidase [Ruegeria lacuscaerulensis]
MTFSIRDIQARCAALGHSPGDIDGMMGPNTRAAISDALRARGGRRLPDLFHPSGLHRIHLHWTAGAAGVIDLELRHYNEVIDHEGRAHSGHFPATAQATYRVGHAASHTLNANTGAIGLAVDCMAGAVERPFDQGSAPMTQAQVDALAERAAYYCEAFDIPVSPFSVLTHAEIQPTLGIRQRWKWDITWLPGMKEPGDPILVGDRIRELVQRKMDMPWAA